MSALLCVGGPLHGELHEVIGRYLDVSSPRVLVDRIIVETGRYDRWRPPVAGPVPRDLDPVEHRRDCFFGDPAALALQGDRVHPYALLWQETAKRSDLDQLAAYADALYRALR